MKIPEMVFSILLLCFTGSVLSSAAEPVPVWQRFEASFTSAREYDNPLYDVSRFDVLFTSPSGRELIRWGFWDGSVSWKVRFMPDEPGLWTYETICSDTDNKGLHGVTGSFECAAPRGGHDIFTKGSIVRPKGSFHLAYADGTPFFWLADTAWNGPLRATDEEWKTYLDDRVEKGYNVIQFVTTQWRGWDGDGLDRLAFTGSGRIEVNPDFFRRLDGKVDRINDHGLVAAPVLLWALQYGQGRHLSPGYHLPDNEAILLARYIVARYGGHHVVWMLGGDGKFVDEYEQRWKNIGRGVFGAGTHPGLVTLHPMGRSWYGNTYDDEDWLDIIGYQSSHSNAKGTVEWITSGQPPEEWDRIPPRPVINLEPLYENILPNATVFDVRNACWWSILATPAAGITYGANGIWSWLRDGEQILNHRHRPETKTRRNSLDLPGSIQTSYIATFMKRFDWRRLRPAQELLAEQPGTDTFNHFISVAATDDRNLIIAYTPLQTEIVLFNTLGLEYNARWFDPATGVFSAGEVLSRNGRITASPPKDSDAVLVLVNKHDRE